MLRGLLIAASLSAASSAASAASAPPIDAWSEPVPGAAEGLTEAGTRVLRAHVAGGVDAELRWARFGDLRAELERLYGARHWTLAWFGDGRPSDAAWRLAAVLGAAAQEGLDPLDYGADVLEPRLAAAERGEVTEAERVRLDVALTVSALRYARDLALGRIRPLPGTELLGRLQLARTAEPPPDLAAVVAAAAASNEPGRVLATVEPDWPAYRRTLAELRRWLARAAADPVRLLSPPPAPIAPERYAEGALLAARLAELGFPVASPAPPSADAAACRSPLAEAVAAFQARRGVDATGFVDAPTIRELNVPAGRRVAQLSLALERWRWFGRRPPASWIVVNVPEFALHAGDGDRDLSMRVVVGQAYEWGTPLLASELSQVVFRPAWSVPLPIQQAELVERVEADRGFLAAGDFDVVDASDRPTRPLATPELISGLRSGVLKLRQRPGPGNALGLVKLSLARSSWIYLHGTPAPELFSRSRRDFSHGCIRVEDPAALAGWVLRDEPGWTPGAVRWAMASPRTLEVDLRSPPTVLIAYFTATAWDEGGAGFYEDVYGQDAALAGALREEAARRGGG
ncbi:MAG TPA: L,D-transpeptidase family protein [Anaeromyxobacteraceae bacterium]|nr:L,D-transpeptidase family protein [Anaeromyxobacteraceae bacterium]